MAAAWKPQDWELPYDKLPYYIRCMPMTSPKRELAFLRYDVARLLRTLADQRVRALEMTRAQWAVLAALERCEGAKQAALAESLEIAPITLTRLVDRLCAGGLVERRADPADRRAKRLFLTPAARPLMTKLSALGEGLMTEVLSGIADTELRQMLRQLTAAKENLRKALPQGIAKTAHHGWRGAGKVAGKAVSHG